MGIINFIVALLFNLYWLKTEGLNHYKKMYNGGYTKWFSALVWTYAFWGIGNLIFEIIKLNK